MKALVSKSFVCLALLLGAVALPAAGYAGEQALPEYQPRQQVSGVIRSGGNAQMGDLLKAWQEGFAKFHPKILFTDTLSTTGSERICSNWQALFSSCTLSRSNRFCRSTSARR